MSKSVGYVVAVLTLCAALAACGSRLDPQTVAQVSGDSVGGAGGPGDGGGRDQPRRDRRRRRLVRLDGRQRLHRLRVEWLVRERDHRRLGRRRPAGRGRQRRGRCRQGRRAARASRTRPASPTRRSPSPTSPTSPARSPASSSRRRRRRGRTPPTSTPPTTSAAASSTSSSWTVGPTPGPTSRATPRPVTTPSPRSARCRPSTPAAPRRPQGCGLPDIRSTTTTPERARLRHLLRARRPSTPGWCRARCRSTSSSKYTDAAAARRGPLHQRGRGSGQRRRLPVRMGQGRLEDRLLPGHRRLGVQLRALRPADEGQGHQAGQLHRALPEHREAPRRDEAAGLRARRLHPGLDHLRPELRRPGRQQRQRCLRLLHDQALRRRPASRRWPSTGPGSTR